MKLTRELFPGAALSFMAAISVVFVVFRAWNQDFTIDEANTFVFYISGLTPDMWAAGSNNHLLSSLLIRAATAAFGYSPFAMRIPAMAFATVFAVATAILVGQLVDKSRLWTRLCLYVLLAFNPFTFDYLVPARGYSPALAFEMVMLTAIYLSVARPEIAKPAFIFISVVAALGVASNYAFLFSFAALLFCLFVYYALSTRPLRWTSLYSVGARLFVPFVVVIAFLCADNIVTMPKREIDIGWGSKSFGAMLASFTRLSFINPNPFVTPPALLQADALFSQYAPLIALGLFCVALILIGYQFRRGFAALQTPEAPRSRFVILLLGALALSLALHLALYGILHVKLPRTRTGIHMIPLFTMFAAAPLYMFGAHAGRLLSGVSRLCAVAAGAIAISFLFALHFSYFQEWKWDADVCAATDTALRYAKALNTQDVRVSWEFDAAGNYYGKYLGYGDHRLNSSTVAALFANDGAGPPTVLILPRNIWTGRDISNLAIVYESRLSGTIVALRNAPGANVPSTPVRFNLDFDSPCHQHGWFGDGKFYPGEMLYEGNS